MSMAELLPPVVGCLCRNCGALCLPQGWERRGHLCGRCKLGIAPRVSGPIDELPDPIRDAIDRAAMDFIRDKGGDS